MSNNIFNVDADQTKDGIKTNAVPKTWFDAGNIPDWITPVIDEKLIELFGEVDAAPTANTVLGRLKELETSLASVDGKDFATETKLEAVRLLVETLSNVDFATETTLAALESKDYATETTLDARLSNLETKMDTLNNKIDAVNTNIDDSQDGDGNINVSQNGRNDALQQLPITGTKTITSTAAELFAGVSRLSARNQMYIRNKHESIAIRIGDSDITDVKGRRILPNDEVKIGFDPVEEIPLYAISEYGDVKVEVFEA